MRAYSFLALSFAVASFTVACSSSGPSADEMETGDAQEVVAARLQCSVVGDACEHAGEGDLNYCVDGITLRQSKSGKVRLEVKRSKTEAGKKRKQKALSLLSAEKTSISGATINASWDEGENWIDLEKSSGDYIGNLTLEQDFAFKVKCTQTGAARCVFGDKSFDVGDSFPDVDGCNTCSCTESGVACTELFCPPQ